MKISLTGSGGFVGQNLLQKLISDGHHVKVLSSSDTSNHKNVTVIKGTLSSDHTILEPFIKDADFIINCAGEIIDEDKDVLLALAGKVSSDLHIIIKKRPKLFGQLIRQLKAAPDNAIFSLVREVKDGDW